MVLENHWKAILFLKHLLQKGSGRGRAKARFSHVLAPKNHPGLKNVMYAATKNSAAPLFGKHAFIIVHGMNKLGPQDVRLIKLARSIAAAGYSVFVPNIKSIRRHVLDMQKVADVLYDCCKFLMTQGVESFSLLGISFSGAATFPVAGAADLKDHIKSIFLVGTYFDSKRVLTRSIQDKTSNAYGFLITIKNIFIEQGVGSNIFMRVIDQAIQDAWRAKNFARTKVMLLRLPEHEQVLIKKLISRDYDAQNLLRQYCKGLEQVAFDSEYRSSIPKIKCPLFILHGLQDDIIPESESVELDCFLKSRDKKSCLVVTSLLTHVHLNLKVGFKLIYDIVQMFRLLAKYFGKN